MKPVPSVRSFHAAIYTRKSSEEGLEQSFNSLAAQREACEAYIKSQQQEGWVCIPTAYDDGGYSGGNTERPGLTQLLQDIDHGKIDVVVVYKVDRLSRSLTDFARLIERFDQHHISFVSVTQQFNTSTSMGRLTLNVLLSFAQFEREVTSERIRDKIAASKKKGMWMGGVVPMGYDVIDKTLVVNPGEQKTVMDIYQRYLALGCVRKLKVSLDQDGIVSKPRRRDGKYMKGGRFSRGALYIILKNPIYIGRVHHKGSLYTGRHEPLLPFDLWETVQEQLASNRLLHSVRDGVKNPSLLAGLVIDDRGFPMSPAHTRKGKTRYRYYVSQAVMQFKEKEGGSVLRIAALVLEGFVIKELRSLLGSPAMLKSFLDKYPFTTDVQKQLFHEAQSRNDHWDSYLPSDLISFFRQVIYKVIVGKNGVVVHLNMNGLISFLLPQVCREVPGKECDAIVLTIPATLKRCGIETKLILPSSQNDQPHHRTVRALQVALGKALQWQDMYLTGKAASLAAIARLENVTQRRIAHLLHLSCLAPDIMEAIFAGDVPLTLTLTALKNGIPLDWTEQRKLLGFSATS